MTQNVATSKKFGFIGFDGLEYGYSSLDCVIEMENILRALESVNLSDLYLAFIRFNSKYQFVLLNYFLQSLSLAVLRRSR